MNYTVRCRAKLVGACLDGKPTAQQFGENLPLSEDGTYVPFGKPGGPTATGTDGGTIVCDPCYIALMPHTPSGMGLHHEVAEGIVTARRAIHGS